MATEGSTEELGEVSLKNPNSTGRKGRHKPGLEQESSLRMALFTCITTRQLKVVLDLCDELEKRRASGGNDGNTNVKALVSSLSKKKATKRVKGPTIPRSRSRPRKKQPDGASEAKADEDCKVEFGVASINIGSFVVRASDSRVPSSVLVRVFFASNRMTYDFCHNRGHNCYKVRYSIQFDDISSMTFFRKAVHLNLVNPAKQDYCVLHAVSDEVAGLVTSLRDAADIDISEGQRESSLLHIILLREDTASTWEEALLRGNRAVFEPIIRGSAQAELTTNATHSNKNSSQMIVLEQMEPNSLSSLSGESMESLDNDHLHSAQQSTEFEPACTPSIKLVDSTTLSSVLSGEDNLDKHRLPELDQQPPVKKFFSEAKMVSTLRSLANGSSFIQPQGLTSRSEEIPMKAKCGFHLDGDHEYHILSGGLDSMRTGEPSTMQTGPIDLERIERIIQSAEDLLRRRKATTEAEAKCGKDAGADGLQPPQMNAKHSPDSFYWLTDVDMDKLAVNYDASGGQ